MKFNKEQLLKVKEFLKYINKKSSKKEKKTLLLLSAIDIDYTIYIIYSLLENQEELELFITNIAGFGASTSMLIMIIIKYMKDFKQENKVQNQYGLKNLSKKRKN